MQKSLYRLCCALLCLMPALVCAQEAGRAKKAIKYHNGLSVGLLAAKPSKSELHLSYDYALSPRSALVLSAGFGLVSSDPRLPTVNQSHLNPPIIRRVNQEVIWFLFIPTIRTQSDVPRPPESETRTEERFLSSHWFASAQYRWYISRTAQHRVQNGLYLAPGLNMSSQETAVYDQVVGQKNQIEEYDAVSGSWGLPIIFGSTTRSWTERITVIDYKQVSRRTERRTYWRPSLAVGYQLALSRRFTADLGSTLLFARETSSEFPNFFGMQKRTLTTSAIVVARCTYWF